MSYRYIALVNTGRSWSNGHAFALDAAASQAGLSRRLMSDSITLFASAHTPTLRVPDGGIIVGHLFSANSTDPITEAHLQGIAEHSCIRRYLTEHCWGEYLLVMPGPRQPSEVIAMRDPSGGVPCVYSIQDGCGFLTSDISLARQLHGYQSRVDWEFVAHFLAYPHMKTRRTGLTGVRELLPGTSLLLQTGTLEIVHEWSPWDFVATAQRCDNEAEAIADVRHAVESVVKAWSRLDTSILLELSGGLDSSIVAACLRDVPSRVECCTLVPPIPGADERRYASVVANDLNRDLHIEALPFERACFDAPVQPGAVTPRVTALQFAIDDVMHAAADRLGVTSYFSGGGGDTIFCSLGNASPAADAFRRRGLSCALTVVRELSELHQCTAWRAGRLAVKKLLAAPKPARRPDSMFTNPRLPTITREDHPWYSAPEDALAGDRERIFDLVNTQSFRDSAPRGTVRPMRLPLLSQPVVEACLRVPSWMWVAGGRNRSIARAAFADVLPSQILNRRSKGTFMSYSGTAYRRHIGKIREHLLDGQLASRNLLDMDDLRRFLDSEQPVTHSSLMRIFDLCMIENWLRHQCAPSHSA
ncbi:asparagine synthetase B family protein [Rhodanobacter glycinis]|uniref:asparagine synthase (glutamine-hydrolyzing) n=1 Tax=Rhodanobacter glycinis TaxID=582702 RepID=A0A502BWV8_9GAMM|nr:asparagine synthetase B family protein [Rhodanobacter glycinis]TPG03996.1 asparagine synthetase B family protein [Rhodanobacter glycinis]